MPLHPEFLCASFGVWSTLVRSRAARATHALADAPIVWIGGAPTDEDVHVVWDAVTRRGITLQPFYRAYARELLGRLDGTFLRIGQAR